MKTAMQELIDELNILERDGLIQIYKSPVGNDMLENILPFYLKRKRADNRCCQSKDIWRYNFYK